MIKKTLALAFLIAALAIGAFAFGSPPTSTKEKPVAVHAAPTTSIAQVQTVIAPSFDASLSVPVEQISIAGEKTKAEAIARRAPVASDTYVEQWIADVPTPPNKSAFNGFANVRAREQV